jgi:lipopolysaccharide biosynthesis protein
VTGGRRSARAIAFYLPQFHPIPENDLWWGPGFTEWTRVRAATPRFPGHEQPQLPGELGYYDLRDAAVVDAQAELARRHGVTAFCYYHYWFAGRRLLGRPLDDRLARPRPEMPFCLCWANEPWSRRWDGRAEDVLVAQSYSAGDDVEHLRFLARVFADPRYLTVRGRPLLLVYRPSALPDPAATAARWRQEAERLGIAPPFLAAVESFESEKRDWRTAGFDVNVEFQPDWWHLGERRPVRECLPELEVARRDELEAAGFLYYRYAETVERMLARPRAAWPRIPCVTPRWDNTPRRGDSGLVLDGSTPERFESWCRAALECLHPDPDLDFLFVNAWNEWAEGAFLEPDRRRGSAYLEALARALDAFSPLP